NGQPYSMEDAFFVRDAFHPQGSPLTAYLNVWLKDSSLTNTNYVDPRLSVVYSRRNDVVRAAVGATSTQPTATDLAPFSVNSIGALAGTNICGQLISVGTSPVTNLKPERGVDTELSWGHRFYEDSQIQVTAYNANVFDKIYNSTVPFSQIGTGGIPPGVLAQYSTLLATQCGYSGPQILAQLGVSGDLNLGRTNAKGIDVNGRQRISRDLFADYTYAITSSTLSSADVSVLQNNLGLIPGSQLPGVPLHTYSVALDYQTKKNYEARIVDYWTAANNAKNSPAFSWANLLLSAPAGPGSFNVNVYNVFEQDVEIRGLIGQGVPRALNRYASPTDYQPLIGAAATERFGLLPRTIEFSYTVHVK
ncbi:MAG TPA: hypothetical protein VKR99_07235, partial [Candidatus Eremiobacteraceae bacterium]|nr:hypothetical protein [Candidatus Eremiobacteraceae bacterium]